MNLIILVLQVCSDIIVGSCIVYKSLQTLTNLFLLLLSKGATSQLLFYCCLAGCIERLMKKIAVFASVFWYTAHLLSVFHAPCSVWFHTLRILGIKFPLLSRHHPPSRSLHMLFLFLVLVKSGTACVFHHRNRHNRQTQPSSGSVNGDQIKSIIRFLCAKAFFLFPSLSLRHSHLILRAVPAGQGGWWA